MSASPPSYSYSKRLVRKIARVILIILGTLVLLVVLIIILVQMPWVQNIARAKAERYLSGKLHTRVEIKKLYIGFPGQVSLGGVYVEDLRHDTLLSGKKIEIGLNMWKLFHGELALSNVQLEGITCKIKRTLPDTIFNFQFIADAFASKTPASPKKLSDTSSFTVTLKSLQLDSVHLVYKDAVTGNDMESWVGHTLLTMKQFNTLTQRFSVASLVLKDTRARWVITRPLRFGASTPETKTPGPPPFIALQSFLLGNVQLDYRDSVGAFYTQLALGSFEGNIEEIDISRRLLRVKTISLSQSTAAVVLGKKPPLLITPAADTGTTPGWRILAANIALDNNNNIQFDNDNNARIASGMDYSHIKTQGLTLHAARFLYSTDSIAANITAGSLKEQSGFELTKLQTNFLYSSRESRLDNLDLRTPHTILRDQVRMRYPSLAALMNVFTNPLRGRTNRPNPADAVLVDLSLRNSQVQLKDILCFAPQMATQKLFRHPGDIIKINSRATGTLGTLQLQQLQVSGIGSTTVDLAGTIRNPTDAQNLTASLQVKNIITTKKDLLALLPPGSIPSNISIPEKLRLSGTLTGGTKEMNANLSLVSSSGTIVLKGYIRPLTDIQHAVYDLHIETHDLDAGYVLQDPQQFGTISGVFDAKGKGLDPHSANGAASGAISAVTLKGYTYHNLVFHANAAAQQITATASAADPNLRFKLGVDADIAAKYPAIKLTLDIDTLNAYALHLVDSALGYHGTITANFANTNPDDLQGQLTVVNSSLVMGSRAIALDTLKLLSGTNDSGHFIHLITDAITLDMSGQYKLTQLADVFKQTTSPYFTTRKDSAKKTIDPYNFTLAASVVDKPLLRTLLPNLKKLSPVTLSGHFSNADTLRLLLNAPEIVIAGSEINGLQVKADGNNSQLNFMLSLAHARSGALDMYATSLTGTLANNKAGFVVNNKDAKGKDRYHLEGMLDYNNEQYGFSLKPNNLLLNYNKWNVNSDNKIVIGKGDVDVHRFELSRNTEKLVINTAGKDPNDSLQVQFDNFKIATLTSFVMADSSRFNGNLQGTVTLKNVETSPIFSSNLLVKDFEAMKDTVGNIQVSVNNATTGVYAATLGITGHGNDAQLAGSYDTRPNAANPINMKADIRKLQLASIQGLAQGQVTEASGYLQGNLALSGSMAKPLIKGTLDFNSVKFNLAMFNSLFQIDSEQVAFDETGFNFDTFTLVDSAGNEAVIDGNVYTTNYRDYKFDMDLTAHNFHVLNSTKKNNKNYYGQLYFTSRLSVKGTPAQPAVDGSLTINNKTNLTVVVPQKEPGVEERKGIVEFVNHSTRESDSTATVNGDSLMAAALVGMNISVNVEIKKEAQLNIVIDPDNGDMLSVKGEALLNAGIDPGGSTILTGTYEISEGSYNLTFNALHRKFNIQKGSTLIWKGAPAEAEADITAIYNVDAPPIDLIQQQTSDVSQSTSTTYRQKLPFQVKLSMKGPILKPTITFDILLPENRSYSVSGDEVAAINYKLEELRKEPSELNKQVFALLLLGRFVGENPFQSSAGGITAASLARKSASALLADQLNQLAGSLIKGVDINFGVVSEDDYSSGQQVSRTDVSVALSKRLFNDRLTVTVGNNFEVEGPQQSTGQASTLAGNLAVDYRLSKDGRYMLRAYRKNGYQGVLEGYVVETGVGFVITIDYNEFKEIFRRKKKENVTPGKKKKITPAAGKKE